MLAIQSKSVTILILVFAVLRVSCQLPDDIQRELNQNLAEQARIQAMRQQHQKQIQNRAGGQKSQPAPAGHDPNNYSYQQVSPPIQYSYYQPYGDAAQPPASNQQQQQQQPVGGKSSSSAPANFDFNNLNFDLPQPQAQVAAQPVQQQQAAQQHFTPSFTGAGGLPVLQPIAATAANSAADSYVPTGNAPLAPQARVQQGPPLTEADFKDITGGDNYGAPGGNDFGLGEASGGNNNNNNRGSANDNTDAQLREFGMPGGDEQQQPANRQSGSGQGMNIPDFGSFNPIGAGPRQQQQRMDSGMGGDDFGNIANMANGAGPRQRAGDSGMGGDNFGGNFENLGAGGGGGMPGSGGGGGSPGNTDFDFASQPSSARGDQAATGATSGGAPGSLQSLLGSSFPGLGGGGNTNGGGLDDFASGNNNPLAQLSGGGQGQRRGAADDGALDIADLGEKSDQFAGADLGGFEQPSPQKDQDYNYAAASDQQPSSVPYPDGSPQPVGTLFALTQPQSLTQTRYNALIDKGTYHEYPAYQSGGNDFGAVSGVVDSTPRARSPGPGRYATPSASALAPEHRPSGGRQYDYGNAPSSVGAGGVDLYL